jgi:LuxR family maltose regulon positive regulatory protein
LAEAKLAAPRQRAGMIQRPRIAQALAAGADAALTLVAAPAGYGKTTAVRGWCASSDTALAWVTLDHGDNDAVRFWTYVATAVDRVREGLGRRALQRLRVSGTSIETAVDELMNGIADYGRELAIVLDDAHSVTDAGCDASMRYAIERLPAMARLIVITRVDPPLELARLRARAALAELRADDLAFTHAEARELLVERAGLELEEDDVAVLHRRTEGWPAALYLAALWLQAVGDQHRAVQQFGGNHRFVAEYLSQEVLASLEADERSFLLRAAVLGRFTAELCDGVWTARTRRPCSPASRTPICSSCGSSARSGFGSTRCLRSSRPRNSPRLSRAPSARSTAGRRDGSGRGVCASRQSSTPPRRVTTRSSPSFLASITWH